MDSVSDIVFNFISLDLVNHPGNCTDYVAVSGHGRFCDDAYQNTPITLHDVGDVDIEFQTGSSGVGTGFLLAVELRHSVSVTTPGTSQ